MAEAGANRVEDPAPPRDDAQGYQRTAIDHSLTIDDHLVFAIVTVDHIDIDAEVAPELRRHTDGVQSRQSICAVTNGDSCHTDAPWGVGQAKDILI